ncbi:MAG: TIR domain-containing protein, partial [bacterium]
MGESKKHVFISYGRADASDMARRVKADLEATGRFTCWLDEAEMRGGWAWDEQIREAMRKTDIVIAILSEHSVRGDQNHPDSVCLDELFLARFHNPPRRIVPIMLLPVEPPLIIYRFHYIDLTRPCPLDDDTYRAKFTELIESIEYVLEHGHEKVRMIMSMLNPFDFDLIDLIIASKIRDFEGRKWLFDEINRWREREGASVLLITGPPGIGKSAIVAELAHRNPGGQVLASYFCVADMPDSLSPERFIRTVAALAAARIPKYAEALEAGLLERELNDKAFARDPVSAFHRGILAPLHNFPPADGSTRYILVDGLDEAALYAGGGSGSLTIVDLLSCNLSYLPPWLRVVATSREVDQITGVALGGAARKVLRAGDPRNRDDIAAFVRRRLVASPALTADLAASGRTAEAASTVLLERGEGNFLFVKYVLDDIVAGKDSFAKLDQLPSGLPALYLRFFQRQFTDTDAFNANLRPILEVLVDARERVPDSLLAAATGIDEEDDLPERLDALGQFLDGDAAGHGFHHRSLGEWLAGTTAGKFKIKKRAGHARLAEAGWTDYTRGGGGALANYHLAHLPAHLEGAGKDVHEAATRLASLGVDVEFLVRRARHLRKRGDGPAALEAFTRAADAAATQISATPAAESKRLLALAGF